MFDALEITSRLYLNTPNTKKMETILQSNYKKKFFSFNFGSSEVIQYF